MSESFEQKLWNDWLKLWHQSNKPRQLGVLVNNELVDLHTPEVTWVETVSLPPLVIICDTNE